MLKVHVCIGKVGGSQIMVTKRWHDGEKEDLNKMGFKY